jgi:predicted secreted hydrolase
MGPWIKINHMVNSHLRCHCEGHSHEAISPILNKLFKILNFRLLHLRPFTPCGAGLRFVMTCSVGILLLFFIPETHLFGEDFKQALPGRTFSFPQDHFSHPEFKTEWWYYSGHLQSLSDQRTYGYQLTFFRTALRGETKNQKSKWWIQNLYFAHLALTDKSKKRFEYREKISRGSLGEAGALPYRKDGGPFRVWIEDWSMEEKGASLQNHLLRARDKDFGIELLLTPEKNPVVHGLNGVSQKAEGEGYASHYYSISRLKTEGKIFLKDKVLPVQGISWMDHEFGSNQLREDQVGWDWFSIQLDNQVELMFYQIRHQDGSINPYSSGTIIFADNTQHHLLLKNFQIEVLERWKSKKSRASYPSKWRVRVSGSQIDLLLTPIVKDQELITKESTRVTYWEGSVRVEGKYRGNPIKGVGYVELTGYGSPFSKGI